MMPFFDEGVMIGLGRPSKKRPGQPSADEPSALDHIPFFDGETMTIEELPHCTKRRLLK